MEKARRLDCRVREHKAEGIKKAASVGTAKESPEGITLIGHNVAVYQPHFYSNKEIEEMPVRVIGRVVEGSRKV